MEFELLPVFQQICKWLETIVDISACEFVQQINYAMHDLFLVVY